ncbi:DUF1385 domain-containing protein [Alkaliphilus transvaalensis]|uniref:DUF1385 domain-containing protein n=1 Tax=Alkaliphilus transvaalensis TaxID=114628 RepID=UPI00047D9816|nr:DUF1385 domain-containing protein [Alkaliphilus transvaalensis]
MKLGGYAHLNGITFFCDIFKLKTTNKKGNLKFQLEWILPKKWIRKLEKKPLIGGISLIYYQWKIFDKKIRWSILTLIALLFLDEYIHIPLFSNLLDLSINKWLLWSGGLALVLLNYKKISRMLRYHGAEHKVINCYIKHGYVNLPLAKESSRFNKRCGTNLAAIFVVLWVVFYFLNFDSIGLQLLLFLVAIQVLKKIATKESKWDVVINGLQWLTVWQPREEELIVAVEGFNKLYKTYIIYQKEVMDRNYKSGS